VAVAARYAQQKLGLQRVVIVDWDVHHGNGTQDIFYNDPSVLLISLQRWPQWPHTGWFTEVGMDGGEGYTVNIPLPRDTGDRGYLRAWDLVVAPIVQQYQPELILLSAGFDAHELDPLGGQRMSSQGFAFLGARTAKLARQLNVKVVAMLEGGYSRTALKESVPLTMRGLLGLVDRQATAALTVDENPVSVDRHIDAVRGHLANYWSCLRAHAS